jgi:predicted GIY-YIG superfamily endonuclease
MNAMKKKERRTQPWDNQNSNMKAYLPYIQGVTDNISKVLKIKEITTSLKPLITIRQRMRSVKDPMDHRHGKGIYKVSCSCGKCYNGETRQLFQVRIKEHEANIKNELIRTSALVEHSLKTKHHVCLEDTKILEKEDHYYKRRVKEALEIIKHPNNMNRNGGLQVSNIWLPLINQHNEPKLSGLTLSFPS